MNEPTRRLLETLGLEAVAPLDEHREALAPSVVGAALASTQPPSSAARLARTVLEPSARWLTARGGNELMLARVDERPGVFLVDAAGFTARGPDAPDVTDDGLLVLDASREPRALLLERGATRLALLLERTLVTALALPPDASSAHEGHDAGEAVPPLPTLSTLLGELTVQRWLAERYEAAARGTADGFARAAALGCVLRLAEPRDREGAVPAGETPLARAERHAAPTRRALAWAEGLGAAARGALVREGVARAAELAQRLEPLAEQVAATDPSAGTSALAWLRARDDLESLCVLLDAGSAPRSTLREALTTLDERACDDASAWHELPRLDDEQLRAARGDDPRVWWSDRVR